MTKECGAGASDKVRRAFERISSNDLQDDITAQAFAGPVPAQTFHGPPSRGWRRTPQRKRPAHLSAGLADNWPTPLFAASLTDHLQAGDTQVTIFFFGCRVFHL